MLGKREMRARFPDLSEKKFGSWLIILFLYGLPEAFGDKILHPTDPIGLQVLPHENELIDDDEGMDDPVGEKKQK